MKLSKRKFLLSTTTATAALCVWEPLISLGESPMISRLRRLSLNGSWQVAEAGKEEWIPAIVPGCVHTDLLTAGKIPDPFYRDNEKSVQWVGKTDWTYRRSFDVPEEVLQSDRVLLHCDGLDTLAAIKINGQEIGKADNMFRTWEFDVKPALHFGENTIEILFASPYSYIDSRQSDQAPQKFVKERAWIRKEPCSFGWDWGPDLPSCGVWRNISLEAFNKARINDVLIQQNHSDGKAVSLDVEIKVEMTRRDVALKAVVSVFQNNRRVSQTKVGISDGAGRGSLIIRQPKLWWPAGMGEQPLYDVQVELLDGEGERVDAAKHRIGLRTMKAYQAENGKPMYFEVNGVPFFAKGGNWIPADSFPNRLTPEILRRYISDAAAVNMNMLRFWGGGYYEDDDLFNACDELGICVWLDFKFACAAYPAFDGGFMENVRLEARDNLQRLRHHPCIAVWCGNNEISLLNVSPTWSDNHMSPGDYRKLFKELLAEQVKTYAPEANYVSGSPDCGDTHYWEVWHGPKNFDAYRTQSGFMSEFGYQSFPEPKTVRAFTNEDDRASVVTPVMRWHQRSGGSDGNQKMVDMIHHYFRPPKDFESTLWMSQIVQAYGIKIGAEYWRQIMPKAMGCVFWQYNDTWPGMSWSSVDYFGRWKALHYAARRFYSPILVSGQERSDDSAIDIFVTSDLLDAERGTVSLTVTDLNGNALLQEATHVEIPPRKSEKIKTLNLREHVQKFGANNLLAWLKLEVKGKVVSDNLVHLTLPKELKLEDPRLKNSIKETREGFLVTIRSEKPALWTWVELENRDARFSDNFVHLQPGVPKNILVQPAQKVNKLDFAAALRIRSLFNMFTT